MTRTEAQKSRTNMPRGSWAKIEERHARSQPVCVWTTEYARASGIFPKNLNPHSQVVAKTSYFPLVQEREKNNSPNLSVLVQASGKAERGQKIQLRHLHASLKANYRIFLRLYGAEKAATLAVGHRRSVVLGSFCISENARWYAGTLFVSKGHPCCSRLPGRRIRRFPDQYRGSRCAKTGILLRFTGMVNRTPSGSTTKNGISWKLPPK